MMDPKLLKTFASVVANQSFELAAAELYITQSAVSQRIKQLEISVGELLIIRASPLKMTAKGELVLRYYRQQQLLEKELLGKLSSTHSANNEKQILQIGINADSLATWFIAKMKSFLEKNNILLDLTIQDQSLTNTLLTKGEVMASISEQGSAVAGCEVRALKQMQYVCVANRAFIKKYFAKGINEQSLKTAPAIFYDRDDYLMQRFLNRYLEDTEVAKKLFYDIPRHYIPSSESYVQFVLNDLAYGLVPYEQVKKEVEAKELLVIAENHVIEIQLYFHYWQGSRIMSELYKNLVK